MAEGLTVNLREERGTSRTRRLRKSGQTPLVLYGHGEANLSLSAPASELAAVIRHGTRLVDLRGAVSEIAFIRSVQWDTYGVDVLHADLVRVKADERIEVTVPIELKGDAPGARSGGIIEQPLHELQIECPAGAIPNEIVARISSLEVGGAIYVRDLPLPEGAKLITDEDVLVVHCVTAAPEEEETPAIAEAGEPEIVGRKKAEDEEAEEA
jgi:large subunit ribosomal protein L25